MFDADAQIEDAAGTISSNTYCAALGIRVPRVEDAMSSADANYYSLLLVALLERGAPMTLDEVAVRFEEAGIASARDALASLKRCKPARAPIYRDGDHYALDPHDDEVSFWLFRLGLRPPRFAPLLDPGSLATSALRSRSNARGLVAVVRAEGPRAGHLGVDSRSAPELFTSPRVPRRTDTRYGESRRAKPPRTEVSALGGAAHWCCSVLASFCKPFQKGGPHRPRKAT